jgi:2'-5' RNA ligase
MTVPRAERSGQALNFQFLPLFGSTGKGVEFDYISPVPGDREADDRERDSKTASYKVLVDAGVDPEDAADTVGLPRMRHVVAAPTPKPEPQVEPATADVVVEWIRDEIRSRSSRALPAGDQIPRIADEDTEANPDHSTGCMLALYPPADLAEQLAVDGGLPVAELHLTVAYCGDAADVDAAALTAVADAVAQRAPVSGEISGLARFVGGEDGDVIVALVDSPGLEDLRSDVLDELEAAGIEVARNHGYTPHITLIFLEPDADSPIERMEAMAVTFGALSAVHGDDRTDYPFGDVPAEQQVENAMRWVAVCENDDDSCTPCKDNAGHLYRNRADAYEDYPGGEGYVRCEGHGNCRCHVAKRRKGDA